MIGALLLSGCLLGAEARAEAPLADRVAALLRQLDERELAARDEAEKQLFELGPDVLPLLPTVGEQTPAEVALRVTRVQQKLLVAQADASSRPSTVTLKGVNLPIAEVFAELSKQTGNEIKDHREAFRQDKTEIRVNVDFDKTPFWTAFDQVLDDAGMTLYGFTGRRGAFAITRQPTSAKRVGRASYSGIFRLEPARFEAIRDLRNENVRSLKLFVEATWEPRLQPLAVMQRLNELSAVGDNGERLMLSGANSEPEAMIRPGVSTTELEIPLALPDRAIKKIATLKGKMLAIVPGPAQDFRFSTLPVAARNARPKPIAQRKAGATVTIDQVRKNNAVWEVRLRVKFDSPSTALESYRTWVLDNEAYFVDASQRRIEPGGFEQSRQAKDEAGVNYFFDLEDGPEKLEFVYRTPIAILELPVEFEFKDLSLP
jgi:hypothetical protein